MKRTKQLSIWIIAFWMAIAAGAAMAQGANMNRYITLTVKSGQDIKLIFRAAAANTPVRVVSGSKSTDVTVGSSWNQIQTFKSDGTTMTVYGDIIGFGCMENGSRLTALDIAHNTQLKELYCYENQLTALNASGCTQLTTLNCHENQLTALDVNGCTQLNRLQCFENQLTALNASGCTQLRDLYCYKNQLTTLNVSGCTQLTTLHCSRNQLTALNVSGCTQLRELYCGENQLTALDVNGYTQLKTLHCRENQLTALNVSGCTRLMWLSCCENQLTALDVSGCTRLTTLDCFRNNFSTAALNQLYCSLPKRSGLSNGTIRPAKDASDPQHANVIASSGSIAIGKNWELQYDNLSIISTTGTETCGPAQNYYDFKAGGLYYKKTSGSTVRVTTEQSTLNHSVGAYYASEGNKPSGHVTVPATVSHGGRTYQVTAIGSVVFRGCRGITSVTLAKSIAKIKDHAFEKCTGLKEVVVAWNAPIAIAADVFQDVPLHEVKLTVPAGKKAAYTSAAVWKNFNPIVEEGSAPPGPALPYDFKAGGLYYKKTSGSTVSVTTEQSTLNHSVGAYYASEGNKPSGHVTVPATVSHGGTTYQVTAIGSVVFRGCRGITSVTLAKSIAEIKDHAFEKCTGLKEVVVAWDTPIAIAADVFQDVPLHEVKLTVPAGKKAAYTSAAVWKNFNPIVEEGEPTTFYDFKVGKLYYKKTSGATVRVTTEQSTLNHSVGAYYASEGNKPSGHVTVPATVSHGGTTYQVTAIGSVVFRGCRGIKSVTLAKSIVEIKDHAFEKCTGLKEVVVAWDTPLAIAAEVFQDVPLHEVKLTVPVGKKAAYTSASVWKNFNPIVEEGEPTTFYDFKVGKLYYKKTSGATVSVSREKDGENGTSPFYADENKPSGNIAIPATVRYGNTTYHVTGIGEGAFATCSGLTNLTIPSSITNIELGAFLQCSGLTNVTIPNSVTNIGKGIFYDCSGLTQMIIPNSIKNIPEIMFMGCTKLTHVTIPSSVTKIEREAFVNCKSLKEMMVYWDAPPVIDANTFEGVALHQVKLIVPVGKKAAYTSAAVWKNFNPIVEASSPVLSVSPAALSMDASGRSRTVTVVANTPWTTTSSATWLTVSPLAGSNNGTVTVTAAAYTGAAPRTATITFMTGNLTRTVSVTQTGTTAVIPATGVAVEPTSLNLEVGQARPLTVTVLPETATTQTVTWTTDNAAIATVSESGMVKGVAPGTAVITATTTDGSHTATCTVTVVRSSSPVVKVTSLKLSATTFKTEAQIIFQLKVTVLPANATDPSVTFTSSDPSIASVDAVTGIVTVYRKGTARITVTANDGSGVTAVCEVTYTVANERVDASIRVYAHDGALRLTLSNPETVDIYNVSGALVKTLDLPAGDHIQPLPSGVYFVRVGEKVEKIFVK